MDARESVSGIEHGRQRFAEESVVLRSQNEGAAGDLGGFGVDSAADEDSSVAQGNGAAVVLEDEADGSVQDLPREVAGVYFVDVRVGLDSEETEVSELVGSELVVGRLVFPRSVLEENTGRVDFVGTD
jgi:hypothetical protein